MSSNGIKLVTLCQYLTDTSVYWRQEDWDANKMVKALKGEEISGFFKRRIAGQLRTFDKTNIDDFLERIPRAMLRAIRRNVTGPATIVPIPNSHVTSPDADNFRTFKLAREIAKLSNGQFSAVPALVFCSEQVKSRLGGTRDPHRIFEEYRLNKRPCGDIVLVDDVCTTGGHMIAAAWKLRSTKCTIVQAAAFARATKVPRKDPIGIYEETLDPSAFALCGPGSGSAHTFQPFGA